MEKELLGKKDKLYSSEDLIGKGGKFLVLSVNESEVFCREKFSEEQKMIANSAVDFAKEQIKPVSERLNNILDEDDISWCLNLTNCFLIRHPKDMLRSYFKKREKFSIKELGLKKQLDIFNYIKLKSGTIPPVIEVNQLLLNPQNYLKKLCKIIEIPFSKKSFHLSSLVIQLITKMLKLLKNL